MRRLLILLVISAPAAAQSLFDDQHTLDVVIAGPLSKVIDDTSDREERPFTLTTGVASHDIKIRVRGKSRTRVCKFPPLRLNFDRDDGVDSPFSGQNKLKLVTHCRGSDASQANVLEELAAYRIFRVLSPIGYRTRLLRVRYVDTGRPDDEAVERFAFVIESDDELAERTGGRLAEIEGVRLSTLDPQQAALVYVFEYMIGNTDWSMVTADGEEYCCHNGDLFDIDSALYYVPFDFDLSGLINASYARPDPSLRIKRVTKRRYRGYCIDSDALRVALGTVRARQAEIIDVIRELPALTERDRGAAIRYLERFFEEAEDGEELLERFERRCL